VTIEDLKRLVTEGSLPEPSVAPISRYGRLYHIDMSVPKS
jgi:hypothetical protein